MAHIKLFCASITLFGIATASPLSGQRNEKTSDAQANQDTLRQVTLLMRHGARAPVDTYPKDPHANNTMDPYGWGQLTNKGRLNVYNEGLYLRDRYGEFLGTEYTPDKFWLQSTSADRAKMTAMILASALWKPDEKQTFKSDVNWQPVALHYWTRPEDELLIIWNACPMLTVERMQIENQSAVMEMNEKYKEMYQDVEKLSGMSITNPGGIADIYATLKSEENMGLSLPEWTKDYYPDKMEPVLLFSLKMNVFNEKLRRLAGGPFLKKLTRKMNDKSNGTLKPSTRKMYAYIAHDNTIVNILSAMSLWDNEEPGYNAMILFELHEIQDKWFVQILYRNAPDYKTETLKIPGCDNMCPLETFMNHLEAVIPDDYVAECKVDDPDYVIPKAPPA